jgi:hypothetical protein
VTAGLAVAQPAARLQQQAALQRPFLEREPPEALDVGRSRLGGRYPVYHKDRADSPLIAAVRAVAQDARKGASRLRWGPRA